MDGQDGPDVGSSYGLNAGRFLRDYGRDYSVQGGKDCQGYAAWRRGRDGRARGKPIEALTLDELAVKLDADRAAG